METGSNDENDSPTKKRKYNDAINGSSDVGEGSVISSELVQLAQAALEDEIAA